MSGSKARVYGRPGCVQCEHTKKVMDKEGIPYEYIDIDTNEVAHQEVKALATGTALPLVVAKGKQWQGFSPDKIKGLKSEQS
ncbi:glutaredoxin [Mycobacterium phage Rope]|uniref:NrdH-like glutaredoxin n=4 Tax=Papyrusvirus TaxID=1982554 RepID=A0A0Y0ADZ9_9CAUD|nr:NrdH-like glutaredoxin [Mycobacterium phage Papyrus]AGT14050.1 NrdH-like glutaredoxin [Mycobacterium phage Papyrus]AMB17254.1 NrdH-like glutaredoxin [Mycobacterium phage Weiss13]AYQ98614.1 NrdH-like glutaredoxin [Mycobacterium phage Riparian]QNN99700.1 glutaredoxin [Mycobacterium phage Rope]